jgi:hypothetical protein
MDQWIRLKEASVMTGRPERTLRHYAVEGKIQVKKKGVFGFATLSLFGRMDY